MLPKQCQMALKEWAITVEAMAQGNQILLLRKGGIHENGKDFRVIHREFLFYPTYLHQKEDLLQPSHQPTLRKMLEQQHNDEKITFSYWAKTEEVLEISDQEKVDDLAFVPVRPDTSRNLKVCPWCEKPRTGAFT